MSVEQPNSQDSSLLPLHSTSEPFHPSPLQPELAEFFQDHDFAAVMHGSNHGTLLVIKAPRREIHSVEGPILIGLEHELYDHPTAPVIRMVTTFFDQPNRPLALETFVNVEDPQQHADYEALSHQEEMLILFFDETHQHRLTKQVGGVDRDRVAEVLRRAEELYQAIPEEQYSFEIAKAWVMAHTSL